MASWSLFSYVCKATSWLIFLFSTSPFIRFTFLLSLLQARQLLWWTRLMRMRLWRDACRYAELYSAVDNPKFMGRPPDHPWWKTGSPNHFLVAQIILTYLWNICIHFLIINTKFACFPFNHLPTYWELGCTSGDFGGSCWVAFGDWATAYPQHWAIIGLT